MAQRDELWQLVQKIYSAVNEIEPDNRWTFEQAMAYAVDKLKEKNELPQPKAA
jgi:ABC-type Zn uptake system ZnuABC Zn-binding protein ZnuA